MHRWEPLGILSRSMIPRLTNGPVLWSSSALPWILIRPTLTHCSRTVLPVSKFSHAVLWTSLTCSWHHENFLILERVIMRTWNLHYFKIFQEVPPKELFDGEVSTALKINSLNNVVIFRDPLDSAPKIPSFESVLWTESLDGGLEISALLDWESLADSVNELELWVKVDDIHLYLVWKVVMLWYKLNCYKFQIYNFCD